MILSGSKVQHKDGRGAMLLSAWQTDGNGRVSFMRPDGAIEWHSFDALEYDSTGKVLPVRNPDEFVQLARLDTLLDRWFEQERVGRMLRDSEGKAVRFVPFKRYLAELEEQERTSHERNAAREHGMVSVFANCVHCDSPATHARYGTPVCHKEECQR